MTRNHPLHLEQGMRAAPPDILAMATTVWFSGSGYDLSDVQAKGWLQTSYRRNESLFTCGHSACVRKNPIP